MKFGTKIWSACVSRVRCQIRLLWLRMTGRYWVYLPLMRETHPATFNIVGNPEIRISEIKARRFYIIDRAQIRAKEEWQRHEDSLIFGAISGLNQRPSIFHQLPYERENAIA